jgi:hypothetical protein
VAWKSLGLVDYPQLIAQPMDLGTVKQRLAVQGSKSNSNSFYKTPWDAHKDILLVWNNCMTYNQDGSEFYLLAASLRKKWEDKFTKLAKDNPHWGSGGEGGGGDGTAAATNTKTSGSAGAGTKASLSDRRNFAKSLYQISREDLGKVLVELEQKHPAALKRNAAEDEIELTVDTIPASLLSELTHFIQACKKRKAGGGGGGGAPKKSKTTKPAPPAVAASS